MVYLLFEAQCINLSVSSSQQRLTVIVKLDRQQNLCNVILVLSDNLWLVQCWFLSSHFLNQFAPGIFVVFPDTHTGLFLAKNLKKFLAINNFCCQ